MFDSVLNVVKEFKEILKFEYFDGRGRGLKRRR